MALSSRQTAWTATTLATERYSAQMRRASGVSTPSTAKLGMTLLAPSPAAKLEPPPSA